MRYYEEHIAKLPKSQRQEYINGPLNFKALMCGTSNFPRPLKRKWSELLGGKRVLERYGTTEFSTALAIHPSDTNCPEVRAMLKFLLSPAYRDAGIRRESDVRT
jgi:malonyl-CoA/methylmalonyl-CoA synthetase